MPRRLSVLVLSSLVWLWGCENKDKAKSKAQDEVEDKVERQAVEVPTHPRTITSGALERTPKDQGDNTYEYSEDPDGTARVKGSDGLDAEVGKKLPDNFPIRLPAAEVVHMGQRIEQGDGAVAFTAAFEASTSEVDAAASSLQAELEAKGLIIERNDVATGHGKMVSLVGKNETGKLEVNCMVSSSQDPEHPGVAVMVNWVDRSAVAD